MSKHNHSPKAEHISGAVFLIGLGLVFITGWWFPGMLFVIGAASMASALVDDHPWQTATGALWLFGLGFIFWLNLPWGVIFVLVGLSCLFSTKYGRGDGKRKHKRKAKNDDVDFV